LKQNYKSKKPLFFGRAVFVWGKEWERGKRKEEEFSRLFLRFVIFVSENKAKRDKVYYWYIGVLERVQRMEGEKIRILQGIFEVCHVHCI
jgi:hypothetical protein